ncbi:glutaredoxin family protein [Glaciihabitans sp. dw_435]|uniref:glutaredoxin family protein n=1 Tax=Glaciihabitans sp. dw_435 TaxID=2720081 RepID=UPI001BD2A5C2|nr:glutaredoxin family protein [Glaciihabitans sp. dw_435]
MSHSAELTLLSRPGCHLCDTARGVVTEVLTEYPTVAMRELSIDDDADLHDTYAEDIPVVLINGKVHNYWRIDPVRLRAALTKETA